MQNGWTYQKWADVFLSLAMYEMKMPVHFAWMG